MRTYFTDFVPFLRAFEWRHYALCLSPSVLMLCCVAMFVGTGHELAVTFKTLRAKQPWMHQFMWYVSHVTPFLSYGLYSLFFLYGLKKSNAELVRFGLSYIILQLLISLLLVYILKVAVGKPRPMALLDGYEYAPFTLAQSNHSFPSGHSSEIMGTITPLAVRRGRYLFSLGLGLVAALVTFSRLYLSMHHLSDIAAGLALGSCCGILILYVFQRGRYDRKERHPSGEGLHRAPHRECSGRESGFGYGLLHQLRRNADLGFLRRLL